MGDQYERIPLRTVRIPDSLWLAAQEVARERGEPLSDVIRASLRRYVRRHKV